MRRLMYVLVMTVVFTGLLSAGVTHEFQLYVKKSSGTSEQQAIYTLSKEGGAVIVDFNVLDWACAEFSENSDMTKVASTLKNSGDFDNVVTRIEPELLSTPNDNYFDLQWYLSNDGSIQGATQDADIDADEAWDYETGSSSTKIGILDSGLPTSEYHGHGWTLVHSDLNNTNRIILGWSDFSDSRKWRDEVGHGTNIAGLIGANTGNATGIAGLDRNAALYISQVSAYSEAGPYFNEFTADLQGAIIDAVDAGCDILNISWAALPTSFGEYLEDAIAYTYSNDVLVVCASGNDNANGAEWPAAFAFSGNIDGTHTGHNNGYTNVISVGATNASDHRGYYSNYGNGVTFAAPGGYMSTTGGVGVGDPRDIFSTFPPYTMPTEHSIDNGTSQGYIYVSGTSFSTAITTGTAALVKGRFPSATAQDIRNYLIASCEKVGGYTYGQDGRSTALGYGRINAFYAVAPPDAPQNISGGYQSGHPHISWDANSEPDLVGYHVYRMDPNDQVDQLTANPIEETEYTDTELGQGYAVEYWYWVTAVDVSEQESDASDDVLIWTGPLNKELAQNIPDGIPAEYGFSQNYPNPFNPSTSIGFGLPEAGIVKLVIYDVQGKPIRTLVNRHLPAGYQSVVWRGQNDAGQQMSTGIYFARLEVNGFSQTRKMILMK
ncbi:MAG: S8 family serine peptidase [Candidatus Marinimicrobia bacterium]|nr:S8 family serine peptidase [Candidatus Neomarinimicrobiota bacterium]